jgi:predicted ATPase
MTFTHLRINDWRQFAKIDLCFHPNLTVITGANGAGKSTLLRILAQHYGWTPPMLATPILSKEGVVSYFSGWFDWLLNRSSPPQEKEVGSIGYQGGLKATLVLPPASGQQYQLNIRDQQRVLGLNVSSHRFMPSYQQVASIPANPIKAQQAFDHYSNEMNVRLQNGHSQFSPMYRMKEALISMAVLGPGNEHVTKNDELIRLFNEFKDILRKVLPPSIGFRTVSIRMPDVVLVTNTGEFLIDASSGGLMSLIDLAWQIFLYSQDKSSFTVTIDEPENHLHPSMQRQLMSSLISAFPKAQFIVVTHSPFIVSSVRDSNVYVLRQVNESSSRSGVTQRVSSEKLDNLNKAGTASEILRDVLGVPVTLPTWAEGDLQRITNQFNIQNLNPQALGTLRQQLDAVGLGEFYPDAVKRIAAGE